MKRRTFLIGTMSGLSVLALSACIPEKPTPIPSPSPSVPPTPPATVPQPSAFARTSWGTDPFSRGSFSYQAVGSTPEQRIALGQPIDGRIFFAGEHTDELSPGTVNGAMASGRRAASEVQSAGEPGERVAVIGAGIAGATAARELADAGFNVVVVEGRDRAGGRLLTVDNDDWPFPIDLGAAWVRDSSTNTLASALAAVDVQAEIFPFRSEQRTPAGVAVEPETIGADAVAKAIDWAATQPADVSLSQALAGSGAADVNAEPDDSGVSDASRLASYISARVVTDSGADADTLSSWFAGDPTRSPEDDRYVLGGFEALVTSALDGIDILPSSAVASITSTDRGISLRLSRGESLSADRVIVTVPLGVLQSNSIEFNPPLPFSHRGAISALGMGIQDKVVLRFDRPFWSTDATVWTVVGDQAAEFGATPSPTALPGQTADPAPAPGADFPLWYNLEPLTGEAVLVGLVGGAAAERLAELGDDELRDAALASLGPFLDPDASTTPPTSGP
ncbi:MAG: oxidoreductase [Cryobacterium sp.]|nr:oxidoreductase [Cryobacterium sp.]